MRSLKVILGTVTLALAATTAGCGSDDTAACDAIKAELSSIATNGMKQISDPAGLAKTYTDGAAKVRAEGEKAGGDVQTAANDLATAMDDFGKVLSSNSGQIPDAGAFSNASIKVNEACS